MRKFFSPIYLSALIILLTSSVYSINIKSQIKAECAKYGVWSDVLYSIAIEESSLNTNALNKKTFARGLMQIRRIAREEYFRYYGIMYSAKDMYDYKIAIKVAHGLLVKLYKIWDGNIYMTLASYHAGTTKVRMNGVQDHNYVKNILSRVNKGNILLKIRKANRSKE